MHDSIDCLMEYDKGNSAKWGCIKATKDAFIAQKLALVGMELSEAVESMRKPNYEANDNDIPLRCTEYVKEDTKTGSLF